MKVKYTKSNAESENTENSPLGFAFISVVGNN